jgi:small subunit ribosomal protein S16
VGAQPTDRVALFLGRAELAPMPARKETPAKSAPKAKAQERQKQEAALREKAGG